MCVCESVNKYIQDVFILSNFLEQLELLTFSLGINTPTVRHIRVFEYAEGVPRGSKTLAWLDITKPPPGLENKSSFKVVVEVDVDMISEDFRMIFKVGLGSRKSVKIFVSLYLTLCFVVTLFLICMILFVI